MRAKSSKQRCPALCEQFINSPPPRKFLLTKDFLKILALENADWTNRWTSIEGAWALCPNMHFYNWLFSWQNKNLKEKSSSGFSFTAKMLHETMHLTFPYLDQIKYN